jgi:hypothetical protein
MEELLVLVRYHCWWPSSGDPYYQYNVSENTARVNFYGADYTPHFWIDGTVDGNYNRYAWESMILDEADVWSPLTVDITGTYDEESLSGQFTVTAYAEMDPGASNLKIRVALVENGIRWQAPNGSQVHNQTFRDMIPSASGHAISLEEGDVVEYTDDFEVPDPLVARNCMLVAWVQSDQNKRVLQAGRILVGDMGQTGVDDEIEIPDAVALSQNYPNPFNANTTVNFRTAGGETRLEVFSVTGSLVKTLIDGELEAGDHSIVWDGVDDAGNDVASGVYFYRLNSAEGQQIRRMTLLK